ncbi:hypothetical protein [Cupriavidus necator]
MAWDTGVHEADVKRFLRTSAVYLFRLRRISAVASRRFLKPAVASGPGATWTEHAPGQRPATGL